MPNQEETANTTTVLTALQNAEEPLTVAQIATATGLKPEKIRPALNNLLSEEKAGYAAFDEPEAQTE